MSLTEKDKELYEKLETIWLSTLYKDDFVDIIYKLCYRTSPERTVYRRWLHNKRKK